MTNQEVDVNYCYRWSDDEAGSVLAVVFGEECLFDPVDEDDELEFRGANSESEQIQPGEIDLDMQDKWEGYLIMGQQERLEQGPTDGYLHVLPRSLDKSWATQGVDRFEDVAEDLIDSTDIGSRLEAAELIEAVEESLRKLTPQQRMILSQIHGLGISTLHSEKRIRSIWAINEARLANIVSKIAYVFERDLLSNYSWDFEYPLPEIDNSLTEVSSSYLSKFLKKKG